ncbi:MAG: GNAT family N-acetyltransferase [Rhizomicrobium sp.]
MAITYSIDEDPRTFEALIEGIKKYNKRFVDGPPPQKFNVALRDENGVVVGGAAATLGHGSMYLEVVWNGDELRGHGHGREMIRMIEEEGKRRGAQDSWLYTMSFQARPFYEKLGYKVVGEVPFPGGHQRIVMWKAL